MQEIIVPDDGLLYKTSDGIPIMSIEYRDDAAVFTILSKNQKSKISIFCHDEICGIGVAYEQKNIGLAIGSEQSEIKFTNENGKITNWIHSNEEGGQIDLADNTGNLLLTMGINSGMDGSLLFLNNKSGDTVVALMSGNDNGFIEVCDENKNTVWSAPND